MFKTGDVVICIDDSENTTTYEPYKNLKKYSTYRVAHNEKKYYKINSVRLFDIQGYFRTNRFISIKEYRKQKLEKICLNQEII